MVPINFYGKHCLNMQFYQPKYLNKYQVTKKQEFFSKNTHALL